MDELMKRCEKSSGPGAVCALTPVTGPQWPSYSSCMPDRLPWRHAASGDTLTSAHVAASNSGTTAVEEAGRKGTAEGPKGTSNNNDGPRNKGFREE